MTTDRIILILGLAGVALMLMAVVAQANDDIVLHGNRAVNLSRPVSVQIVDRLPTACGGSSAAENYGCAVNAFGSGRCIVYVRSDKMAYVYHELQHCEGENHADE